MIATNSIIKFKDNIKVSDIPFTIHSSLLGSFLKSTFKVISVTPEYILFHNDVIGNGVISPDEVLKYFEEVTLVPSLNPDPTPYSPIWTKWTEYTLSDNTKCLYRYKDTAYGSVKLECNFTPNEEEPFIGRATCHKDDVFDLDKGIQICRYRSKIKDYKSLMMFLETLLSKTHEDIEKCSFNIIKETDNLKNFLEACC